MFRISTESNGQIFSFDALLTQVDIINTIDEQKNRYIAKVKDNQLNLKKDIIKSIKIGVNNIIGPIARPDKILIVSGLPKTRSGKIMRRILRKIVSGDFANFGDTSTLLDPDVVEEIIGKAKG